MKNYEMMSPMNVSMKRKQVRKLVKDSGLKLKFISGKIGVGYHTVSRSISDRDTNRTNEVLDLMIEFLTKRF